jgi:3-oxoacyl-[acyl-carrier protein] reductase
LPDGADGRPGEAAAPRFVETSLTAPVVADPAMREEIVARTSPERLVTPDEVATAILFPASDTAAAVTGCGLVVDGGWIAQ